MKKVIMMAVAAALVLGCEKEISEEESATVAVTEKGNVKKFTFTVKGDFSSSVFNETAKTRAVKYLTSEDNQLTDLWIYDFVGNDIVDSIHQQPSDASWGSPSLHLSYGTHHVCFVASRGSSPVTNAANRTIVWNRPSDTFWKDYEVTVTATSNGNRAVTLDRVATKISVTVEDAIPQSMATIAIMPSVWYYGLNYRTGAAAAAKNNYERAITVPLSYIGTSGELTASIFGISNADEWNADVTVTAKDSNGESLGTGYVQNASIQRNRATALSGGLFSHNVAASVAVNDEWNEPLLLAW